MRIRINYIKNDKDGQYHLIKRDDTWLFFLEPWCFMGKFKTLEEAEDVGQQLGINHGEKVIYEGIYENGKRIGMTGWKEEAKVETLAFPAPENQEEFTWTHKGKSK